LPIGTPVKRVGEDADFILVGDVRVKIHSRCQRTRQQKGAVNGGQFALPGASAGPHVEKMVIEAMVARSVGFRALRAVPEKPQRVQRSFYCRGARHESALDTDRIAGQGEAGGGDARGPIRRGLVDHQPVGGIRLMQKVAE
jgi:hypothetical protein